MLETGNTTQTSDHDLLIRIETKMENLICDIKDLKTSTNTKTENHEDRIKKLENKIGSFVIYISLYSAAVATLIGILVYHVFNTPSVTP